MLTQRLIAPTPPTPPPRYLQVPERSQQCSIKIVCMDASSPPKPPTPSTHPPPYHQVEIYIFRKITQIENVHAYTRGFRPGGENLGRPSSVSLLLMHSWTGRPHLHFNRFLCMDIQPWHKPSSLWHPFVRWFSRFLAAGFAGLVQLTNLHPWPFFSVLEWFGLSGTTCYGLSRLHWSISHLHKHFRMIKVNQFIHLGCV